MLYDAIALATQKILALSVLAKTMGVADKDKYILVVVTGENSYEGKTHSKVLVEILADDLGEFCLMRL